MSEGEENAAASPPPIIPGETVSATKEDLLEDGTRVVQTTYVETFPDGSQCKRTVTKRIKTPVVSERYQGRPTMTLGCRDFNMCCCFIPCSKLQFLCCCCGSPTEDDEFLIGGGKKDETIDEETNEGVRAEEKVEES